jgi:ABC-2 type transport system permease protein
MSAFALTVADSTTMVRRNFVHMVRYPVGLMVGVALPAVFLLLFVYVLGDTLGAGLGVSGGREEYLAYVIPGILIMTIASGSQGTAISVAMDMSQGIVARFRTMDISRAAVVNGHVLGNATQSLLALVLMVGIALLVGFRPVAGFGGWLAVAAALVLITLAITWVGVVCGMVTKSVENASNLPLPLVILPFFGSGFIPADAMPDGLRWFAEHQPFTPFIETVRGLLEGRAVGGYAVETVAWCVLIIGGSYLWARRLYDRRSLR